MTTTLNARVDQVDRVATVTAAACAVHCAVTPIVVPLLSVMAGHVASTGLEWGFTATSAVLGTWSLGHSYRSLHRSRAPLAAFAAGMSVIVFARFFAPDASAFEAASVATGGSLIVLAHVLNARMRRARGTATSCACACHTDAYEPNCIT